MKKIREIKICDTEKVLKYSDALCRAFIAYDDGGSWEALHEVLKLGIEDDCVFHTHFAVSVCPPLTPYDILEKPEDVRAVVDEYIKDFSVENWTTNVTRAIMLMQQAVFECLKN